MATNKFFTWTKGAHDTKKRKPLPLDFHHSPAPDSATKLDRTNDSIALQDAAVASATSLLAVMNDCLNSHLLSTQQYSGGLRPMHGRPRSRTAPSTPAYEMQEATSPVELPGCIPPLRPQRKHHTVPQSMDSRSLRVVMSSTSNKTVANGSERPRSSPQSSQHALPALPRQSCDSFAHTVSSFRPAADVLPRAHTTGPYLQHHMTPDRPFDTGDDTLVGTVDDVFMGSLRRPSLNYLATWQHKSPSSASSQTKSPSNTTIAVAQSTTSSSSRKDSCVGSMDRPTDAERDSVDQIYAIRAAHEAHISSLKETHDREIASHRQYIAFLESNRTSSPTPRTPSKRLLTIDTSHMGGKSGGLLSSDGSATTSLQSFESSLENQKRASSEAIAEAEALKRKLSLCRKAQFELGDVRRERDQLRDSTERSGRRIAQLKDIVRKAKENEKAMKNAMCDLEAALVAANNERTDVLEGFYEACGRLKASADKEKHLIKERDELRNHLYFADPAWAQQRTGDGRPSRSQDQRPWRTPTMHQDPLIQTLDELRRKVADKEKRIQELESKASSMHRKNEDIEVLQQRLVAVQVERDRYNTLLHSELRRQNRQTMQRMHAPTPQVGDDANAALAQRLKSLGTPGLDSGNMTEMKPEADSIEILQEELKHCYQEIIMYKLDIKGYKKDLKQVSAQIDALETTALPTQKTPRSSKMQEVEAMRQQPQAGLGISGIAQPPTTPQRNLAKTSTSTISTTATPEDPLNSLSPAHRPVTPFIKHKKLPMPPFTPPGPSSYLPDSSPIGRVQRNETLRSLSESIISSYAKRGTPEQGSGTTTPARSRSTDPMRASLQPRMPGTHELDGLLKSECMSETLQRTASTEVRPV